MSASTPSYGLAGEQALGIVLERFVQKHPDEAEEYRSYFAEKGEILANIWLTNRIARIDPKTGVGGAYMTQMFPFADAATVDTYYGFEKAVYDSLE